MNQPMTIHDGCVAECESIEKQGIVIERADELLVENGYIIVIYINTLVEGAKVFYEILIIEPFYDACFDDFALFLGVIAKKVVADSFGEVKRKIGPSLRDGIQIIENEGIVFKDGYFLELCFGHALQVGFQSIVGLIAIAFQPIDVIIGFILDYFPHEDDGWIFAIGPYGNLFKHARFTLQFHYE